MPDAPVDRSNFSIKFESLIEMLEVLSHEFGDMIPLETTTHILQAQAPGAIAQLRAGSLIETLPGSGYDPLMWEFTLTSKGTLRAKNLAKAVGLLIKLEVDLD